VRGVVAGYSVHLGRLVAIEGVQPKVIAQQHRRNISLRAGAHFILSQLGYWRVLRPYGECG
jgi:hypothetical protein